MLTLEFIAGFVNAQGSFIEYTRNGHIYHAFQIKSSVDNSSLLNQIASTLDLHNRVYAYNKGDRGYSLLIVRDRESILNKIIPALKNRLVGPRSDAFENWCSSIKQNSSTWNYRNIKTTGSPERYQIVDKNPNSRTKRGG